MPLLTLERLLFQRCDSSMEKVANIDEIDFLLRRGRRFLVEIFGKSKNFSPIFSTICAILCSLADYHKYNGMKLCIEFENFTPSRVYFQNVSLPIKDYIMPAKNASHARGEATHP